jgi:hypothetical protein
MFGFKAEKARNLSRRYRVAWLGLPCCKGDRCYGADCQDKILVALQAGHVGVSHKGISPRRVLRSVAAGCIRGLPFRKIEMPISYR